MEPRRTTQSRTCSIAVGMLCAALAVPSLVHADAYGAEGVGPSEDIILGAPSVTGFVNDGDETVVETVLLYMNGCPVVSITPPDGGRGMPIVTSIEQTGDCTAGRGTGDDAVLEARGEKGMHVQLWTDAENDDPASLVIEVSSLYPDAYPDTVETTAGGIAPFFYIPGVFGDPSGDLTLASGSGRSGIVWGGGGNTPGWPGGGSGGSGGGVNVPGGTFLNTTPSVGPPPAPPIAAVPLPATLLLLLWALQLLRSYVRRT